MDSMHIRRAHPADLETLVQHLGRRQLFDDRFARQSKRLGMLLTGWRDGRPVGVIYLWIEEAEEPEIREHLPGTPILNHLEIHPSHRGRGAGTALVAAAERRLRMLGFERVALAVEVTNSRAARLYRRLGYEEWQHEHIKCHSLADSNGERHVEVCQVMVKRLARKV